MKHLIKNKDRSVTIMTMIEGTSVDEEIKKWHADMKIQVESHRSINDSEIPSDPYFRDAWAHKDDKLVVDMGKATEIHKNVLREMRAPILDALDKTFMRALESGDSEGQKLVTSKKQALRDITKHPLIINATTPDELKSFIPDILTNDINV